MNIEDIFPEIYKQVNEDKNVFTPQLIAKNIYDSPYFEYIKEKVWKINADVSNHNPKIESEADVIQRGIYSGFLYHGSPASSMEKFKYLDFHERSEPKDTNIFIHNYVNKLAKEKHGVNVRNGMFVTTQISSAKSYGAPYLIFPLGEYKIYYSEGVLDFTDEFATASNDEFGAHFTTRMISHLIDELEDNKTFIDNVNDSPNGFFGYIADEIGDEQFKTFKAFKQRIIDASSESLEDVIRVPENFQKVMNTIKRALGSIINSYLSDMKYYVDKITYTHDPMELKKYEGMVFFKNSYAILKDSDFIVDVFLELIALVE